AAPDSITGPFPVESSAPIVVLYGDLSLAKRTSRWMRNTLGSASGTPLYGAASFPRTSARSAVIGATHSAWYRALLAWNQSRLISTASSWKNPGARFEKPV